MVLDLAVEKHCLHYYEPSDRLLIDTRVTDEVFTGLYNLPAPTHCNKDLRDGFRYLGTQQGNTCMIQLAYAYFCHLADSGQIRRFDRSRFPDMVVRKSVIEFRSKIDTHNDIEAKVDLVYCRELTGVLFGKCRFDFENGKAYGELTVALP